MLSKKIILIVLISSFSYSCSKQPKCNDEEVQTLVVKLIKETIENQITKDFGESDFTANKNYSYFKPIIEESTKLIDSLELKIHSTITDDVKKEINKCECQGEISSVEKSKNINEVYEDLRTVVSGDFRIARISPKIKYTAQITDEDKIYVTILNLEEIKIFEKNIYAKILYQIRIKNSQIENNIIPENSLEQSIETTESNSSRIERNKYYDITASADYPVYFYNSPRDGDRKKAKFTTSEKVYVENISSNNFAFITFTNNNNQTTKGWIRFEDLE